MSKVLRKSTRAGHRLLIVSERAFDAEMLRSAIRVYNSLVSRVRPADNVITSGVIPTNQVGSLREDFRREFGWVPQILAEKARSIGISQREVKWAGDGDAAVAQDMIGELMVAGYGPLLTVYADDRPRPWYEQDDFPDSLVLNLPVHARYIFEKKRRVIYTVAFPSLTTSELCSEYVAVLLGSNKWGFTRRIRVCKFTRPDTMHHLFLAQVRPNGALMPGYPQRFCSPEHSNSYRQREYRRKHSAPRRPK